jgi:excisionase family DNA binding protein
LWETLKFELLRAARELAPEHLPRFFGDLEEVRREAEMRLHVAVKLQQADEVLLTVAEASKRLGVSADTLYRQDFPFTRRVGRRRLFSRNGIDAAIRQNDLNPGADRR